MEQEVIDLETKVRRGIIRLPNLLKNHQEEKLLTSVEYSEIRTTIIKMCTKRPSRKSSKEVYDLYKILFEDYINYNVIPTICEKHGEDMVREFVEAWTIHGLMVHWMSRLFDYLEEHFIPTLILPSLKNVGYGFFYHLVYTRVNANIKDILLCLIRQERIAKHIDRELVKDALRTLVEIGIQCKDEVFIDTGGMDTMGAYRAHFETFFLEDREIYYAHKATKWMDKYSLSDYLRKTQCIFRREEKRATYLHSSTLEKSMEIVRRKLIYMQKAKLLEMAYSCWSDLQKQRKFGDLQVIVRLYWENSVELLRMANMFEKGVKDEGESFFKQAHDALKANRISGSKTVNGVEDQLVQQVFGLYEVHSDYIDKYFRDQRVFHVSLKKAFGTICNTGVGGMNFCQHLVTYCDHLLKNIRSKDEVEDDFLEGTPKKVGHALEYVYDKDVFGDLYEKKLAQRLLSKKYVLDHERAFIASFKQVCGRLFTSKMDGMIKDVMVAGDFEKDFQTFLGEQVSEKKILMPGINFKVTTLKSQHWPSYKSCNISLPKEMVKCVEEFKQFYATKTENRKLTLIDTLGSCTVRGYFDARAFDLVVATQQAALLLLFNDAVKLSYEDMKSQLNISDEEVVPLLYSLSFGKYDILKKYPKNDVVAQSDIFEFNNSFVLDNVKRIRIPLRLAQAKEKESQKVIVDRRYAVDASIVRIMKVRKNMRFQELEKECSEQCKQLFRVDRVVIKRQVESLIVREYLERDSSNQDIFHYVG